MAFSSARAMIFAKANPKQYPAPAIAIDAIENMSICHAIKRLT